MANPKSLTFALYSHWDVIERLVLLGREFPAFEQDQVIAVIAGARVFALDCHCRSGMTMKLTDRNCGLHS